MSEGVETLDVATGTIVTTPDPAVEAPKDPQPASSTPAQNAQNSETATPTSVDDGGEEGEAGTKKPGKNYYARKIDELHRREAEANRRADQALQTAQQALAEVQRVNTARAPAEPPPNLTADLVRRYSAMPDAPRQNQYSTFDEYVLALSVFGAEKRIQEAGEQRERQEREQREATAKREGIARVAHVVNGYLDRVDQFTASTPDYEETTDSLSSIVLGPQHAPMVQVLMQHERAPEILYHLGKNPREAQRIASFQGPMQAAALADFAARIGTASSQVSNAPPPARVVRSGRAAAGDEYNPDWSVEEFLAWEARKKGKK